MTLVSDFFITQGDTGPPITAQLQDAAGAPVNIVGATVTFRMAPVAGGALKVNAAATVVTAATGDVRYAWTGADTDTAGYYRARWRVVYGTGVIESFPNDDDLLVLVTAAV